MAPTDRVRRTRGGRMARPTSSAVTLDTPWMSVMSRPSGVRVG